MNKSRFLILILSLILTIGCKNDKTKAVQFEKQSTTSKSNLNEGKTELKSEKINSEKIITENEDLIDLEKESKIKFGDYFLTYNKTNISLCCKLELHNPLDGLDSKTIKTFLTDYKFRKDTTEYAYNYIYSKGNSIFKIVELRPEKSGENATFIGQGKLVDDSITLSNGIKIGMDKNDFLDKYFVYSKEAIDSLSQVAVCEDERGELFTKYKFEDGKLIEIEFGSPNEK
ncbi:hypothetical protein [Aquimarina sp. Aq107]|uniref:hypothetical protein n=1 Tax=Aquimarina sp. Aq107 TaxID=1191912 RepID=UPI000D555F1E|nr:hypothetical protein [Aquimarina sp. Aq107]